MVTTRSLRSDISQVRPDEPQAAFGVEPFQAGGKSPPADLDMETVPFGAEPDSSDRTPWRRLPLVRGQQGDKRWLVSIVHSGAFPGFKQAVIEAATEYDAKAKFVTLNKLEAERLCERYRKGGAFESNVTREAAIKEIERQFNLFLSQADAIQCEDFEVASARIAKYQQDIRAGLVEMSKATKGRDAARELVAELKAALGDKAMAAQ